MGTNNSYSESGRRRGVNKLVVKFLITAIVVSAGYLFLVSQSQSALEPGILSGQMNSLIRKWGEAKTDPSDRAVDIIISDALAANASKTAKGVEEGDIFKPGADILPVNGKASFLEELSRKLFRRSMAIPDSGLAKALKKRPDAITWTHKGQIIASEAEMTREIMRAILKADEAGAGINIVTEGFAAAPALKAIDALKTVNRNGHTPMVNKLVAVNMNIPTLKQLDPGYFSNFKRPENLKEWSNIWSRPSDRKIVIVEVYDSGNEGKRYTGEEIFLPHILDRGLSDDDISGLVTNLLGKNSTMEQVLDYLRGFVTAKVAEEKAKTSEAKKKEEEKFGINGVVARDLKGRAYKSEFEAKPATGGGSSLDMVGMSEEEDADKTEKKNKPARKQKKKTDNTKGNAANCKGNPPKCNWYDAKAYCKGRLPGVAQLKSWYNKECSAGWGHKNTCGDAYWSAEEPSADAAKTAGHYVTSAYGINKTSAGVCVHCR